MWFYVILPFWLRQLAKLKHQECFGLSLLEALDTWLKRACRSHSETLLTTSCQDELDSSPSFVFRWTLTNNSCQKPLVWPSGMKAKSAAITQSCGPFNFQVWLKSMRLDKLRLVLSLWHCKQGFPLQHYPNSGFSHVHRHLHQIVG